MFNIKRYNSILQNPVMIPNSAKTQNGIFTRTTLDFKREMKVFKLTSLSHVYVKNGEMLAAISDKILLRQSVSNSDRHQEMPLPLQSPDCIAHVHLAFTGFHALVSTKQGRNFYIHMKSNTVHELKKLKCVVTAIGWNPECLKDSETGPVLLGTQQGSIIELSVTSSGIINVLKELTPQLQASADQKLTSSPSPALTVSDIQLFVVDEGDKSKKWLVIITQMTRIVLISGLIEQSSSIIRSSGFTSSASLQAGFMNMPESPSTVFHSLFNSKDTQQHVLNASKLSEKFKNRVFLILHPASTEPKRFAWLSPDGIIIGKVDVFAEKIQDVLIEEFNLEHRLIEGRIEPPIGVVLTDYHVVLAYSTRLLAITLLSPHNVVFEDIWGTELGQAVGFTSDPSSDFMWLHTSTVSMRYKSNDEARYIWKTYLDRGEYNMALKIARTRLKVEPEAYEMVLRKQADWYIEEKNYTAAAEILAQSSEPFESVVLKFLTNPDERRMGLKTLLDKKLERLTRSEDKIRRDAIVMWLLEVQLSELAEMRRKKGEELKDTVDHVQRYFMRKNVFESIQTNIEAVYRMCVSHAEFDMQLFFANAVKDIRTIISILMLREQFLEVLQVLGSQPISELTYEMCPLLIEHIPKQMIGYFVKNIDKIRPEKLASTLALCMKNNEMAVPAIKYLEILINSKPHVGSFLHNLLIQLIAKFRSEKLIVYLQKYGTLRENIPYDFDFAMRTCEQFRIDDSIVYLFCVAEMYADAVEKALGIDIELAKKCAKMMDETEENDPFFGVDETVERKENGRFELQYKKRIWLKIAKFVSVKENDLTKCIELISESNQTLTIQDVLPLFPEFTKIDHFKDALVDYLQEHAEKIRNLQQAMKDATQTAAEIREKTEKLKNRVTVIKAGDVCSHCSRPLAGRPFFVHACRHFFHRECLESAMLPFLSYDKQNRLKRYVIEESRLLNQIEAEQKIGNKSEAAAKEKLFEKSSLKIAQIIGSDCPLCGTVAINQIDVPFLTDEEFAEDENSWLI